MTRDDPGKSFRAATRISYRRGAKSRLHAIEDVCYVYPARIRGGGPDSVYAAMSLASGVTCFGPTADDAYVDLIIRLARELAQYTSLGRRYQDAWQRADRNAITQALTASRIDAARQGRLLARVRLQLDHKTAAVEADPGDPGASGQFDLDQRPINEQTHYPDLACIDDDAERLIVASLTR